jgi:hypothetical protein
VTLKSFSVPTGCTGPLTRTSDTLNIGRLSNGTYKLSINLKDVVLNNGYLSVNPNLYIVDLQSENGISMPFKQLSRIPENTIWGYVNHESSVTNKAQAFMDSLKTMCQTTSLLNGRYGHFEVVHESLKMPATLQYTHPITTTFFFKYEGTEDKLDRLIQHFRLNANALNINLTSQTGKQF